ncbi:MAG: DUF4112 domain-containing protein [Haloferacaceae archaeon]
MSEPAGLRRARLLARLLDDAIRVPGTSFRVGLDPLLSVFPVGGSVIGAVCSLYVVAEAALAGVPPRTLAWMLLRVVADAAVGALPFAGPLADAAVRANRRNVAAFERAVAD